MIRRARPQDTATLAAIAHAAHQPYIARIGRPPAPMLADYDATIRDHDVRVADRDDIPTPPPRPESPATRLRRRSSSRCRAWALPA
jgi:hypothetical protein